MTVVGKVREERDSSRGAKLRGMMKLEAGIGEPCRCFRMNRLPHPWGRAPSFVRFLRNQFHGKSGKNTISIRESSERHKQVNRRHPIIRLERVTAHGGRAYFNHNDVCSELDSSCPYGDCGDRLPACGP